MNQPTGSQVPGLFTLVLHTHLPWLAHHGRWPVGEEWLYQSWSAAYLPLLRVLRKLAGEDRRRLITLGMTPVVTRSSTTRTAWTACITGWPTGNCAPSRRPASAPETGRNRLPVQHTRSVAGVRDS